MTVESKVPYDTMSTSSVQSEPAFTKCCFCFPLRIGCFVLGYLNLIFNTIHTLALLTLTTFIGISTHGFDHFDADTRGRIPETQDDKTVLSTIGALLVVILLVNAVWVIINVACLVGLHKKRPGPIRVYVGCASARLVLSLAGFVYLLTNANARINSHTVLTQAIDLGLAAYYIMVYYVYANQLEREQAKDAQNKCQVVPVTADIAFICQSKADKTILV